MKARNASTCIPSDPIRQARLEYTDIAHGQKGNRSVSRKEATQSYVCTTDNCLAGGPKYKCRTKGIYFPVVIQNNRILLCHPL